MFHQIASHKNLIDLPPFLSLFCPNSLSPSTANSCRTQVRTIKYRAAATFNATVTMWTVKWFFQMLSQVPVTRGALKRRIHLPEGAGGEVWPPTSAAKGWEGWPSGISVRITWRRFSLSIGRRHVSMKLSDDVSVERLSQSEMRTKICSPKYLSSVFMSTL